MIEQLIQSFVPAAYAADAAPAIAGPQGGGYSFILMLVVFFAFIYFAIWRPQSKRAKEQQNLLGSLAKGDEVITIGGLLGAITKMNDQYITLSVADNVDIVMQKSAVASVVPKGTLKKLE